MAKSVPLKKIKESLLSKADNEAAEQLDSYRKSVTIIEKTHSAMGREQKFEIKTANTNVDLDLNARTISTTTDF